MRKLLACVLALSGGVAGAAQFTVGVEALDYYPHYRSDAKGEFSGYARAVLDAFAADSGHQLSYRPLPVTRLYAEFVQGKVDFKYPDNAFWGKDAKGEAKVLYSAPVTGYVDGLMVLPARAGATDIKSLGIVAGFTPFPYKDDLAAGKYTLEERSSMDQLLKGVLLGRIDSAYVNIDVGRHALKTLGEEGKLVFNEAMPADRGNYHLSTLKHAEVLAQFDAWLQANGPRLAQLRGEYGLAP